MPFSSISFHSFNDYSNDEILIYSIPSQGGREGNMCADFLAEIRTRSTSLLIVLNPRELHLLLLADSMCVVYHRDQ